MNAEDQPLSVFGEGANAFPKLPILSAAQAKVPADAVKVVPQGKDKQKKSPGGQ